MVPCPWYFDMAKFCQLDPELDYGIPHFNGGMENYPFKPCSPYKVSSLVNENDVYTRRDLIKKYLSR